MPIDNLEEKFGEFSEKLRGVKGLYILSHDNPDPDSLASMYVLRHLLMKHFRVRSLLLYGGEIGRAENRAMVRLLKIPVHSIDDVRLSRKRKFVLVDTQPSSENHSLPEWADVLAVFDHHPAHKPMRSEFHHVDEELGATGTMIYDYVQAAGVELDWRLATAMAYALITETQDLGREARRDDLRVYQKLIPRTRLKVLSSIKNPILPKEYYQILAKALANTYYYKNIVVTRLGTISSTAMVHQMADLLLRFERRSWALAIGWSDEYILLSLRSSNERARCGKMISRLVRGRGSAGGHDMVAGGRIECSSMSDRQKKEVEEIVISRFLHALGHGGDLDILMPLLDNGVQQEKPV